MLEIAESNSETSNNSARLVAATFAVNIAKLIAAALALNITAAPPKLAHVNACKGGEGNAASSAT
jgi:hypothetical protein